MFCIFYLFLFFIFVNVNLNAGATNKPQELDDAVLRRLVSLM